MAVETEKKLLNAALNLFSKKGYQSTTTMAIASEAGVSEKTLFRKFKTKKNLFDQTVIFYIGRLNKDFNCKFKDYNYETPSDFLKAFIMDLAILCTDNYEIIHLVLEDTIEPHRPAVNMWIEFVSSYAEDNIKNEDVDYPIFTMTILFFIYSLVNEKMHGRAVVDFDDALVKFADNLAQGI